jgi:hypothetical protein
MATTTNYSWTTPDDTDLVKDGASAIRSLGTAIDTTVFNNADAAINKTIVDAKGDIIAATAADTVSRLAVGANNTVLTADSTEATGLKWATPATGAYTSLASGTLSGTEVSLTSISGSYVDLYLVVNNPFVNVTTPLAYRVNATAGSGYQTNRIVTTSTTITGDNLKSYFSPTANQTSLPTSSDNVSSTLYIRNYAATGYKTINSTYIDSTQANFANNFALVTAAITSIQIRTVGGNTFNGGTYTLYGVK